MLSCQALLRASAATSCASPATSYASPATACAQVYLNGKRIATNNFSNYVDLFLGPKIGGSPRVFEKVIR